MGIHKVGVTMKHSGLLLFSLYLSLPSVFSLSCMPQCPPDLLKDKKCNVCKIVVSADCRTKETVKRPCTRCPVCAKAEGEKCNGLWGLAGKCASFLTCKLQKPKDPRDPSPKEHWPGVCVKKEVKKVERKWQQILDFFSPFVELIDSAIWRAIRNR